MYTDAQAMSFSRKIILLCITGAPLVARAQAPVGDLFSTTAQVRGSVTFVSGGTSVLSGSSITSGASVARLQLNRGGNLNICSGTSVSVSSSANGRDLMFSFGTGAIATRYSIAASSDVIITPDLRLVITGPGEFDLDVGITPTGDTCVHSYRDSTGGVIVNEQMGDGSYQVKPSDFVLFHKSRVDGAVANPDGVTCGCPAPKPPAQQTYVASQEPRQPAPPQVESQPQPEAKAKAPTSLEQPLAAAPHVVADAPFVFNADNLAPALTDRVMRLHVESKNSFRGFRPEVQPPPITVKPAKKGFWHRLGHALFG
jgi:hypothetical protein